MTLSVGDSRGEDAIELIYRDYMNRIIYLVYDFTKNQVTTINMYLPFRTLPLET